MIISNDKLYDKLKWIAQILLPALGTLYFALAAIWHFPNPEQVSGTVLALDAFLGVILGISNMQYKADSTNYDGDLFITPGDDPSLPDLTAHWNDHPDEFGETVTLRTKRVGKARLDRPLKGPHE